MTTLFSLLLFSLLILLSPTPTLSSSPETKTYVILTNPALRPSNSPTFHHWYASTLSTLSNHEQSMQSDQSPPTILHTYTNAIHGFSATLTQKQASLLESKPFVESILPDRVHQLHTTRSPQFIGLSDPNSELLEQGKGGDGIVIAFVDTGINPTHRSFRDEGIGEVPKKWKGSCQSGTDFPANSCNNKLVGAKYFAAGFQAEARDRNISTKNDVMSPLDTQGHGTHTASIAAGRPSNNSSFFNLASGNSSGMAPNAHIAAYKVCWSIGCFSSDVLAAMDQAVADGADIISISLGAMPGPYHTDPISIASFSAASKGIFVSASAGNDGPGDFSAMNISPWITTVGAGSIDRDFPVDLTLGNGQSVSGTSLYVGPSDNQFHPLVYSSSYCLNGTLDPEIVRGKVIVCDRSDTLTQVEMGLTVKEAGGIGIIITNGRWYGNSITPALHLLPAAAVGADAEDTLHAYIQNEKNPTVRFTFHGTRLDVKPAPVVARFSGRGPNMESDWVLKPDMIAPGVAILAAWTDKSSPTGLVQDLRRTEFNILSGTSMSCPHVSGIAALMKAVHPDWSPAAVKSAMMTTASVVDNTGSLIRDEESWYNMSIVWATGSGYVNPRKCVDPGLVYDVTVDDYIQFLCSSNYSMKDIRTITRMPVNCSGDPKIAPWDLNYPSISLWIEQDGGIGKHDVIVHRTVTNVGEGPAEYVVRVENPKGATVEIQPTKLKFQRKGEKLGFVIKIQAEHVSGIKRGNTKTEAGSMSWTDGNRVVRSPVAVTWAQL